MNYELFLISPRQRDEKPAAEYDQRPGQADTPVLFFEQVASHEHGKNNTGLSQAHDVADPLDGERYQNQRVSGNADHARHHNPD